MGRWWPASGLGAVSVAVHVWDLLRESPLSSLPAIVCVCECVKSLSRVQLFATLWTVPQDPETPQIETELCLSVSCGGMGQQWPAAGTGALAAGDLVTWPVA